MAAGPSPPSGSIVVGARGMGRTGLEELSGPGPFARGGSRGVWDRQASLRRMWKDVRRFSKYLMLTWTLLQLVLVIDILRLAPVNLVGFGLVYAGGLVVIGGALVVLGFSYWYAQMAGDRLRAVIREWKYRRWSRTSGVVHRLWDDWLAGRFPDATP